MESLPPKHCVMELLAWQDYKARCKVGARSFLPLGTTSAERERAPATVAPFSPTTHSLGGVFRISSSPDPNSVSGWSNSPSSEAASSTSSRFNTWPPKPSSLPPDGFVIEDREGGSMKHCVVDSEVD